MTQPSPGQGPLSAAAGRNSLVCTILFFDLVAYSQRPVDEQATLKKSLTELIEQALKPVQTDRRLAIDTGDGGAICLRDEPSQGLRAALALRALLAQRHGDGVQLRIGLNLGPVRIVPDINHRMNVIGDGINVAQRIMDLAQPGQVLVSRAYHDALAPLADGSAALFRFLGRHADKHGRLHEVHVLEEPGRVAGDGGAVWRTEAAARPRGPSPAPTGVQVLERTLSRYIGPMAGVLVRQALEAGLEPEELVVALSGHIDSPIQREAFRQQARQALAAAWGAEALRPPGDPPRW